MRPRSDEPRIRTLADGTVRHRSPFTDTEVWSVPTRQHRPRPADSVAPARPIDARDPEGHCDFCAANYLRTTPEKTRVRLDPATGDTVVDRRRPASRLDEDRAAFRRIANLYEIVPLDYWIRERGYRPSEDRLAWQADYLAEPAGERHVRSLLAARDAHTGVDADALDAEALRERSLPFFAGAHELIVAERHYARGAASSAELAGSGSLTPDEHHAYVRLTLEAAAAIAAGNDHVSTVAVFQNWRSEAGASFEHLHKQLLGIDAPGRLLARKEAWLADDPDALRRHASELVDRESLGIARAGGNALAYVEVGQPYPTVTILHLGEETRPDRIPDSELRAFSDLLHACHRALGPDLPLNEEWQMRRPRTDRPMPLHVHLRFRDHTVAGFEGVTGIHVSPLRPEDVRDRVTDGLRRAAANGALQGLEIGL